MQVPAGSAADIYIYIYVLSVWAPGPCPRMRTVTRPNPWAQDTKAKLVIRSAGLVPSPGVSSWLKIFLTANLFTRTHSVRVLVLSAGAGGSRTFVHAVSQQPFCGQLSNASSCELVADTVLLSFPSDTR